MRLRVMRAFLSSEALRKVPPGWHTLAWVEAGPACHMRQPFRLTSCGSTQRLDRNATDLPEHACAGEMPAHLHALEFLLLTFGSSDSFEPRPFPAIALEPARVETDRAGRRCSRETQATSCDPDG